MTSCYLLDVSDEHLEATVDALNAYIGETVPPSQGDPNAGFDAGEDEDDTSSSGQRYVLSVSSENPSSPVLMTHADYQAMQEEQRKAAEEEPEVCCPTTTTCTLLLPINTCMYFISCISDYDT